MPEKNSKVNDSLELSGCCIEFINSQNCDTHNLDTKYRSSTFAATIYV